MAAKLEGVQITPGRLIRAHELTSVSPHIAREIIDWSCTRSGWDVFRASVAGPNGNICFNDHRLGPNSRVSEMFERSQSPTIGAKTVASTDCPNCRASRAIRFSLPL